MQSLLRTRPLVQRFLPKYRPRGSQRRQDLPYRFLRDTAYKISAENAARWHATYRLDHAFDTRKQGADLAKPLPTSPHALAHVPEYLRRLLRPAEVARCLSEEGILIRERGAHE